MIALKTTVLMDNGTKFTHKTNKNGRWYLIGVCGVCGLEYTVRNAPLDRLTTCHNACAGNGRKLPPYIEDDHSIYKQMDGELWHNIMGFTGYWVSRTGQVKGRRGRLLTIGTSTKGRPQISVKSEGITKTFPIHRLVAEYFVPNNHPMEYDQVNHIDGDKTNNHYLNLEWCNGEQNHEHKMRLGLNVVLRGEDNCRSKLTEQQVLEIYSSKDSYKELQFKYGVSKSTISSIKSARNWRWLTEGVG